MTRLVSRSIAAALLVGTGSVAGAQQPAASPPAVRPIGPVTRVSPDSFGSVSTVRALPGGRLLVNDITSRRVVLLDSTLKLAAVVADSTSSTANAYGARLGGLIAYRGDSTLFVDPTSLSMLVIDPAGKITRVMSAPRPSDVNSLIGGPFGNPAFDAQGRLVYRGQPRAIAMGNERQAPGNFSPPQMPDSAPLVRVDLATRALDTLAFYKIPKTNVSVTRSEQGNISVSVTTNPMPVVDDWAVLADGSIAIVRGRDYHVDFVNADGTLRATPKIPFEWQRLDDDQKTAFLDSTRTAMEKARANMQAMTAGAAAAGVTMFAGPGGGDGGRREVVVMGGPGGGGPGGGAPRGGGGGGGATTMQPPAINLVPINELPDYRPAFGTGATRADAEGNLWIRTSHVINNGSVYDVVNRQGELIDRVQLPPFRVIAGFAPGGIVYMGVRDGTTTRLERARVR